MDGPDPSDVLKEEWGKSKFGYGCSTEIEYSTYNIHGMHNSLGQFRRLFNNFQNHRYFINHIELFKY